MKGTGEMERGGKGKKEGERERGRGRERGGVEGERRLSWHNGRDLLKGTHVTFDK